MVVVIGKSKKKQWLLIKIINDFFKIKNFNIQSLQLKKQYVSTVYVSIIYRI